MARRRRIPDWSQRLPHTREALTYAERQHAGQRRAADGAPFIVHPLEVARLLYHAGAPDHVIAAGLLHDTIEKTDATAADLTARFGLRIATIVLAVSEDQRITGYAERKAALRDQVARAGHDALMVLAADKISKVRELKLEIARRRAHPAPVSCPWERRLTHYRHCLRLLEEHLPDSPLVTTLTAELEKPPPAPNAPPPRAGTVAVNPTCSVDVPNHPGDPPPTRLKPQPPTGMLGRDGEASCYRQPCYEQLATGAAPQGFAREEM
jgi:HD domain